MNEYHFDSDNVLKSVIRNPDDHSRRYGIKTYHDLETCIENRVGTICAVIDWQTKSFKIGGKLAFRKTLAVARQSRGVRGAVHQLHGNLVGFEQRQYHSGRAPILHRIVLNDQVPRAPPQPPRADRRRAPVPPPHYALLRSETSRQRGLSSYASAWEDTSFHSLRNIYYVLSNCDSSPWDTYIHSRSHSPYMFPSFATWLPSSSNCVVSGSKHRESASIFDWLTRLINLAGPENLTAHSLYTPPTAPSGACLPLLRPSLSLLSSCGTPPMPSSPAPSMLELNFDTEDVLKSVVRNVGDSSRRYGIETYHDMETCVENRVGTICAVIDWTRKSFKIGGKIAEVSRLKRKAGSFSSTRLWRWSEGEEYTVRYSNSTETWSITTAQNETVAELRSCITPLSGPVALPVLRISSLVRSEDERLFFLLLLLYSETRRLDREA
ncbi:unnamed protein product [Mycena citricolor]|uniref:Uncharacterized protein n=1 Tax=Mycena citricolor TaxID=2018698 RepID=A0AAD2HZI6_9AGAR|nr:unnamed protein product [Mycena citricolor]